MSEENLRLSLFDFTNWPSLARTYYRTILIALATVASLVLVYSNKFRAHSPHATNIRIAFVIVTFVFMIYLLKKELRFRRTVLEISSILLLSTFLLIVRRATWPMALSTQQIYLGFAAILLFTLSTRPWFRENYIGVASARQLGWMRAVVCASMLVLVIAYDIVQTVWVPVEFMVQEGPLKFFFDKFPSVFNMRSPVFLGVVRWSALVSLTLGMVGLFTRPAIIVGTISFMLFYYVEITYTHFCHSGWIPLQMLFALCFMPCGDGFALSSLKKPTPPKSDTYGLAIFTGIVIYGLSYYVCSLSKWHAEPFWATEHNLLRYFVQDAPGLIDHVFGWNLIPEYVRAGYPQWIFGPLAVGGLFTESSGILLIFFRRTWKVIPFLILGLHIGIQLTHKFLFAECIVLPLMFINLDWIFSKFARSAPSEVSVAPNRTTPALYRRMVAPIIASVIFAGWCFHWQRFPISAVWAMYAGSGYAEVITYQLIHAVTPDGKRWNTDLTDIFTWAGTAKWQDITPYPFEPIAHDKVNRLLQTYASLYNADKPPEKRIVKFDFEYTNWNFVRDPQSPTFGEVIHKVTFDVKSTQTPK